MKTPDQQVSEEAVAEFKKERLLKDDSLKGLDEKLAGGKLGANEWKVLFKLDAAKKGKNGENKT